MHFFHFFWDIKDPRGGSLDPRGSITFLSAEALGTTAHLKEGPLAKDPSVVELCHDWHDAAALVAHPTMGAVIQASPTVTPS